MPTRLSGRLWMLLLVVAAGTLAASPAFAQYFGRNKVQYRSFKYEVLKTRHFDVYYYAPGRPAAEDAARKAERWYARLSQVFQHRLSGAQPLIVYLSHADFEQTNVISEEIGEGTGGFTDVFRRRIVMPLGATPQDSDHVVGHELVHAFQFDITTQVGPQGSLPGAIRLPLWFIEGMAEYLTIGADDPLTSMWVRDAITEEKLPTLKDLEDSRFFPYRWGQAFWAYVAGRWGDKVIGDMLRVAGASGDATEAIKRVLEVPADELVKQWHQSIRDTYKPVALATKGPAEFGKPLIKEMSDFGSMNLAPALSPDGKRVAFLSQRDLFSVDLYVADAETGKIVRKLTHTAVDPHFTSLGFISSAGAWAPDNRRFAFAAMTNGKPAIVVLDIDQNKTEREIPFSDLGEIFSVTWSPDGKKIAFSAHVAGFTDLFVTDLDSSKTRRLTNDQYADLQPAWSPDGKSIAFVTDRFSTRLDSLALGNYRIGLMDPDSGAIRPVEGFDKGRNINPQWAPDGRSLYYLSDINGISNLYRHDLVDGRAFRVTNLYTGIGGITALSPAMSVAASSGRTVFSVREKGNYNIYAMPEAKPEDPQPSTPSTGLNAALLPPAVRVPSQMATLMADATTGLPAASGFKADGYKPKLGLDSVASPTIAFGVGRWGTYAGGGITLVWSDLLGDYTLATGFQLNSGIGGGLSDTFKNSALFAGFLNLKHRWNYGITAQQVPYLAGGYSSGYADVGGQYVGVDQGVIFRQVDRGMSAVTAYPFNQARRVEFSAGYQSTTFEEIFDTVYYDPATGQTLGQDRTTQKLGSLSYGLVSSALVFDTTQYGPVSPILGSRYRVEVSPTFGQIKFTNMLADYRRYFMPVSFYTVAVRALHYGRYGQDSSNQMLYPLYLGYPSLVRGYDVNSFSAADCGNDPNGGCPVFDSLLGSKILVGNVELRFPLLRPFGVHRNMYGPLPIEAALFVDSGVAWDDWTVDGQVDQALKPAIFGGKKKGVSSAGVGLRVNAMGFAIVEFDFVKPFQRPNRGWTFQFSFSPSF